MKLFSTLNSLKNNFNISCVFKFILCSFFASVSGNDRILRSISPMSEHTSTQNNDVNHLLELCFADQLNPIIISPELTDMIRPTSFEEIQSPIMVLGSNYKFKDTVYLHNTYPTYLLMGDTTENIKALLGELRRSAPFWSMTSKFFIVGTGDKSCLRHASQFLKLLWTMELLSSFYLCPKSQNYTMIYTFNPFTNYAPHPWKEIETTDISVHKQDNRWTMYNLRFTKDKDLCRLLDFNKVKLLEGYKVKTSTRFPYSTQVSDKILPSLNLTRHILYDERIRNVSDIQYLFKNGISDMTLDNILPFSIDDNICHIFPVYYDIKFSIATQKRNLSSVFPETDSVIDPYTGIFIILILVLITIVIALINRYQFGAAFLDVYLLLLNMGILLPIDRFIMRFTCITAFLFAFVFSPALQGQFFALITKPTYRNIETLKDLRDNNYQVHYWDNVHYDIMNTGLWTTDEDKQYLHVYTVPQSFDCLKLASKHSLIACIDVDFFILENASKYGLYVSKDFIFPKFTCTIARADWALKDRVGQQLLHAYEAGFSNYVRRDYVYNKIKKNKAVERAAEFDKYDLVDETDLIPLYMFTAFLYILAVIAFFFEHIISKWRPLRRLEHDNLELQPQIEFINEDRLILDEPM